MAIVSLITFVVLCSLTDDSSIRKRDISEHAVFIDIQALIPLHPCFGAIQDEKRFSSFSVPNGEQTKDIAVRPSFSLSPLSSYIRPPSVDRKDLVAETALTAVGEFSRLEAMHREALGSRLQRIRATIEASVEPELAAQIRELERAAAEKEKELSYLVPENRRRELQIRIAVLLAAVEHLNSVFAASRSNQSNNWLAQLERDLEETIAEQKRLEDAITQQTAILRAELGEKISDLRSRKKAEFEGRLAEIEMAERTRIEAAIAEARNEVFSGLGLPEEAWQSHWSGSEWVVQFKPVSTGVSAQPVTWRGFLGRRLPAQTVGSIESQIRRDVAEQVRRIAAKKGLRVTFVVRSGVRNATRQFRQWLTQDPNLCWSPVLSAALR